MFMEGLIYKSTNSCNSKRSTLRAPWRNSNINSNKFACPSAILMFYVNWMGIKQQDKR